MGVDRVRDTGFRRAVSAIAFGLVLCAAAAPASAACKRLVISGDADYPPLAWYDGETMRGASIDVAVAIARQLNLPYELRYAGPFPRVLLAARNGEIDVISELKDTPERHAYLAFPTTPIFVNPVAVFTLRDRPLTVARWEDLKGRRGGITLANKFGGGFDEFLERNLQIEQAPRLEAGFDMLAADRIDYFVTGYYPGIAYLIRRGLEDKFKAVEPFVTASDNFLGVAKASPCIDQLPAMNQALAKLVESGEVERLVRANLGILRTETLQTARKP